MYDDYPEDEKGGWAAYFAPMFEARTYTGLVYLLLALPLGTAYFTVLVTGFSLAFSLLIILVGIPILAAVLWLGGFALEFERRMTNGLLGTRLQGAKRDTTGLSTLGKTRYYLTDLLLWRGQVYLFLKFFAGVFLSVPLAIILLPLGLLSFAFSSTVPLPLAIIALLGGLLLVPLSARGVNWMAELWAQIAYALIDETPHKAGRRVRVPAYEDPQDDYILEKAKRSLHDEAAQADDYAYEPPPEQGDEKPKRHKSLAELLDQGRS